MKLSQVLQGWELSKDVLASLETVFNPLIGDLVEKYDNQLRKNGEYLNPQEKRDLIRHLLDDLNIKLNVSTNITEHKMKIWEIYPTSEKQQELKLDFDSGESVEGAEALKQAVLFEVGNINQGEDRGADPELGPWDDPVLQGTGFDSDGLEQIINPDYENRKAAFEAQEEEGLGILTEGAAGKEKPKKRRVRTAAGKREPERLILEDPEAV